MAKEIVIRWKETVHGKHCYQRTRNLKSSQENRLEFFGIVKNEGSIATERHTHTHIALESSIWSVGYVNMTETGSFRRQNGWHEMIL